MTSLVLEFHRIKPLAPTYIQKNTFYTIFNYNNISYNCILMPSSGGKQVLYQF